MTSLLSAKKRAEEFAAAVDGGADRATLRPELAELVAVVGTLQRETAPAPRPEFTAALRERLMTEAATSLAADNVLALPPRRKGSRERRIVLAASSLVLVGGTAGMAAAAQSALPGEALYPIKRGLEKAQTGLATSDTARGQDLLAQADSRLVEVQGLLENSVGLSQVPATIDDFTTQAFEASNVLLEEYEETGDEAIIEELRTFTADNLDELRELAETAPPEHHDELAIAAELLMDIDERAAALCPECTELKALQMPTLFLTTNEVRKAMDAAGGAKVDNSHPVVTGVVPSKSRNVETRPDAPRTGGQGTAPEQPQDTGGSTTGGGGTGEPTTPDLPTGGVEVDGPSADGSDVGKTVDEVTKGVLGAGGDGGGSGGSGGSKDTSTGGSSKGGGLEKVIPKPIDDIIDVVAP